MSDDLRKICIKFSVIEIIIDSWEISKESVIIYFNERKLNKWDIGQYLS